MGNKLPSVRARFNERQANLAKQATNVYTMMGSVQGLIYFPTPAVPLVALVVYINAYTNSLATARKGSKMDTEAKDQAKADLIAALRAQALYVTSIAQVYPGTPTPLASRYSRMRQVVLASGFQVNKVPNPVADNIGIVRPIVRKAISQSAGTLHLLLRQYTKYKKGTKTWQLQYRTSAHGTTPAGDWVTQLFTSGNITAQGLPSVAIDYQVGAVGGHNTRTNSQNPVNYTTIQKIVIT